MKLETACYFLKVNGGFCHWNKDIVNNKIAVTKRKIYSKLRTKYDSNKTAKLRDNKECIYSEQQNCKTPTITDKQQKQTISKLAPKHYPKHPHLNQCRKVFFSSSSYIANRWAINVVKWYCFSYKRQS